MSQTHIKGLSELELIKGLLPLMNHTHWAYLEEYLLREREKAILQMSSSHSFDDVCRSQGKFSVLTSLINLKSKTLSGLRK